MKSKQEDTHHSHLGDVEKNKLLAEINYLNSRLKTIGYTGDCAYEKKLSSFYQNTISNCQQKLLQY
ncbi:hypothetical protein [sulfur-oxidizing endosymbiont of Gigantopelta aegis]|uniref:hypothetical protein n=1 Tax=sulfur-oxidizing endosymbiont of Gigantopelta aegis TaxID=2794934 RepID=UPI0018DD7C08|nr:hypothetical protein [sulfur-oxidizing endosymbiont of Gigantopelta aegis]